MFDRLVAWTGCSEAISPLIECRELENGGRGLFAVSDIPPNTPLITVPGPKLFNKFTLGSLYPSSALDLTSTQLLSLHLFLHRDGEDDPFAPFIASLPKSFDSHPVSWYARSKSEMDSTRRMLLEQLISRIPPWANRRIIATYSRYRKDLKAVRLFLRQHVELTKFGSRTRSEEEDYIWSWLCVNTRCIHLPITSTYSLDEDLTLVPLIDLINHSSDSPRTCQFEPIYTRGVRHGLPGAPCAPQSVILRSPASLVVNAGEEILLQYGHHCNTALFAEYGFILDREKDSDTAEISLDYVVEPLLHSYGLRELLQRWDYWLDWTIHTSPPPAHPSYRLLTVLRLLALPDSALVLASRDSDSSPACSIFPAELDNEDTYDHWKATVLGFKENVSETNESKGREKLLTICRSLNGQARDSLSNNCFADVPSGIIPIWLSYAEYCLHGLWREAEDTTRLVMDSIEKGEEF